MMTRTMESSSPLHQGVEKTETGTPVRYAPLQRFYSSVVTSTASGSSLSKKIKARKLNDEDDHHANSPPPPPLPLPSSPSNMRVYARRPKKLRHCADQPSSSFLDYLLHRFGSQTQTQTPTPNQALFLNHDNNTEGIHRPAPNSTASASKPRNSELLKLGIDSNFNIHLDCPSDTPRLRLRPRTNTTIYNISGGSSKKKLKPSNLCQDPHLLNNASASIDTSQKTKSWVDLSYEDVHPTSFVGLTCKVYWPLDDEWYSGSIVKYDPQTYKHQIQYNDGDNENLNFKKEKIKFHVSPEEMQQFNLKVSMSNKDDIDIDYGEMLVLAATLDECTDLEPGGIIWAKLTGHAVWPAVVVDESDAGASNDLKQSQGERSIPVQFFGTYDFARITVKQVIPFLKGLLASYHLKCKQGRFRRSLEEAKMYLSEQKLPNRMVEMQNGTGSDCDSASEDYNGNTCAGEDLGKDDKAQGSISYPFNIGDLCILSLGKIVTDSEHFRNEQYIWPEGYTAERKFVSVTDPSVNALYKMEVLRHPESKFRPFFRVTMMDNGEQFKGSSPPACWNKIYRRIRRMQTLASNSLHAEQESKGTEKPGSHMFGFSNPKVHKLIQELSYSRMSSVYSGCMSGPKKHRDLTVGYRPVQVGWKDLDKCNVCHMDEEYENNLFLQCDKCRMMVHSRCYGELQVVNGVLWLCNLCRPGAPESPPRCCLCPVTGGAMKPTTNGLWAHLACAIWIPETCLLDIKRMEPIDGLNRIHKDRWKLLCSICGVSYGACIQCSNRTCRVAYHPLCARAAGLCVELEDEDRLHLMSFDEDEEDQCIRLLSFCKKHRQPTNECSPGEPIEQVPRCCSSYSPPLNPSGSARCEPYDFLGRRGRKEPEALAAASLKRLYVENRPYLVTGYCQNGTMGNVSSSIELGLPQLASFQNLKSSQHETTHDVLSMAKRYTYMKETFRKRLAFGKSGIHGFGIFAKHPHRAGDMVIEYTGEMVRPSIADRREHFIYNSLVGAGTYMFRIDDERVIDATRAGSIAHLINHSCEPNCYSRSIKVHGDEHIIIFAKRDISEWEELTYDYRFLSIDEQLACYCGFTRCRGVVNDIEAEEHITKLCVPRSKLIDWTSTS